MSFSLTSFLARRAEQGPSGVGGPLAEGSIYMNFCCFADKVGGHVFWIQGDATPLDSRGQAMQFIGQMVSSDDIEIGDSGLAYFFFSPDTQETTVEIQYF